jgi:GNAT superfamily N-acetyltransferase
MMKRRRSDVSELRMMTFPEAEVPVELRGQMLALQDQAWPAVETIGGPWHDPALAPVSALLVRDDGKVLAALDVLSKEVEHAGDRWSASGLAAVVTDEAERGHGYGGRLVAEARRSIAASCVDIGLFTCDAPLLGFYERAGWEHLPGTVLIGGTPDDPFPSDGDGFDKATLGGFFSGRAQAQREAFFGVRIELYPGSIDRLW